MMLFLSAFLLACGDNTEKQTEPETVLEPSQDAQLKFRMTQYRRLKNLLWVKVNSIQKQKQRTEIKLMKIAHVKTSMEQVSGGISWEVNGRDKWDDYSIHLESDYQFTVREDRTISVMFRKYGRCCGTCLYRMGSARDQRNERTFFSEIEPDGLVGKIRLNWCLCADVFTVR